MVFRHRRDCGLAVVGVALLFWLDYLLVALGVTGRCLLVVW